MNITLYGAVAARELNNI